MLLPLQEFYVSQEDVSEVQVDADVIEVQEDADIDEAQGDTYVGEASHTIQG